MQLKNLLRLLVVVVSILVFPLNSLADKLLVPMDFHQTNHLKAYGVAYWIIERGQNAEWLLNYRGGSFMTEASEIIQNHCRLQGVFFELLNPTRAGQIYKEIEENNMEVVPLEKAPSIAIYTPSHKEPWDDAVTLALTYAEIPYTTLWDEEVLTGELEKFDWLHLHHEDFTAQYGKFYAAYRNALWYKQEQAISEKMARRLGYKKVSDEKKVVAQAVKDYVARGGFLFAMCSAGETMDISLSAKGVDIVPQELDGDPIDPGCQEKLDYSKSLAFTGFKVNTNALQYEHSNIDTTPDKLSFVGNPKADFFTLFDFSAKLDPVPTMLVQNHVNGVNGFMGQTTGFRKDLVKRHVIILGETVGQNEVKYLHGNFGRGTFTFFGGHDPEDYQHRVGDPPTDLSLHKNSPGYRLILNNVLFPAAKKKERKT